MREYSKIEIEELIDDEDIETRERLLKSLEKDIPCVGEYTWSDLGCGSGNPKLGRNFSTDLIKGKLYVETEFHDVFKIENDTKKIIRNKKQLKKFLRKKYYDLTKDQHNLLNEFWRKYPSGIITFG